MLRRNIKKLLREAVGVPSGIVDGAKHVYDLILDNFDNLTEIQEGIYTTKFNVDVLIGGKYIIDEIQLILEIHVFDQLNEPQFVGFAVNTKYDVDTSVMKLTYNPEQTIQIFAKIGLPKEGIEMQEIYDLFVNQKSDVVKSIAHELMHSYDYFKKATGSILPAAAYQSYSSLNLDIPPIRQFIFFLYFIHMTENLVRPSEIAASMDVQGVTKKNFLEFLKNNRTYSTLKLISEFSYEGMKKELENYIDRIDVILKGLDEPINISNDEKIEKFLNIAFITMTNHKADTTRELLKSTPLEKMLDILLPNKEKFFMSVLNKIFKFKNHKDFFEYEEKMFKFVAKKLMKKISKLYSISKEDKDDIHNWELHQKLNKKTEYVKESKFLKKTK